MVPTTGQFLAQLARAKEKALAMASMTKAKAKEKEKASLARAAKANRASLCASRQANVVANKEPLA